MTRRWPSGLYIEREHMSLADDCTGNDDDSCRDYLQLPHQCGPWTIGNSEGAKQLAKDLLEAAEVLGY